MTDPASTALVAPRLSLGDSTAAYKAAVERARTEDWATRLFARDVTLWTSDQRVGEAIADRLGWLDAPAHFADRTVGLEASGTRSSMRATRRSSSRDGWQQPRPGGPPSDVRFDRGLPGAAHPRLDRPGVRVGHSRRPRSAADARHHRHQVRDDDRAERLPGLCLGSCREGPESGRAPSPTSSPAQYFAAITDPDSVGHIAHPTSSARSSSTHPISAGGTRR